MNKDFSDELVNEYTKPAFDEAPLDEIFYATFRKELQNRLVSGNNKIKVKYLLDLMMSSTGKLNQENHLLQLQFLTNGEDFETKVKALNQHIEYITEDHASFKRGDHGEHLPDFSFTINDTVYTLDTKTYRSVEKAKAANISDFHKSKFIIAACLDERRYYYRYQLEGHEDVYSQPLLITEVPEMYIEALNSIALPQYLTMVYILTPKKATDIDLLNIEEVEFSIFTYKLSK